MLQMGVIVNGGQSEKAGCCSSRRFHWLFLPCGTIRRPCDKRNDPFHVAACTMSSTGKKDDLHEGRVCDVATNARAHVALM